MTLAPERRPALPAASAGFTEQPAGKGGGRRRGVPAGGGFLHRRPPSAHFQPHSSPNKTGSVPTSARASIRQRRGLPTTPGVPRGFRSFPGRAPFSPSGRGRHGSRQALRPPPRWRPRLVGLREPRATSPSRRPLRGRRRHAGGGGAALGLGGACAASLRPRPAPRQARGARCLLGYSARPASPPGFRRGREIRVFPKMVALGSGVTAGDDRA